MVRVGDKPLLAKVYKPRGAGPFTIREVWLSYIRDDCVENDHVQAGLLDDSLLFATRAASSDRPSWSRFRRP